MNEETIFERVIHYQIECIELYKDKSNLILINDYLINLCIENKLIDSKVNDITTLTDMCIELGISPTVGVIGYGLSEQDIKDYYVAKNRDERIDQILTKQNNLD